ncbi:MAG TPA: family 16 glycoside hydrolase [Actinopolymorphaceae bacterium]
MRKPRLLVLAAAVVVSVTCLGGAATADSAGERMYTPTTPNESNAYARVIRLQHAGELNGRLLATFEHWYDDGSPAEFIIRASDDDGATWSTLATVPDAQTGPGHPVSRMWQPFLFEFPRKLGGYPAGTLLLVGNTVPADAAVTEFFLWRSTDHGSTWDPVGVLQRGGTFGRGIWEPFLTLDARDRLLMYFADERDAPRHSQMIVHVVSTDGGDTWGPVVRDVASAVAADRPGMPTVTRMGPNGKFVLAYEVCGRPHCEIRLKESADGSRWSKPEDLGVRPETSDGRYLGHSPYVTWLPTGPKSGQLVLAGQRVFSVVGDGTVGEDYRAVFLSDRVQGPWSWAPAPWRVSNASSRCNANYSPHLMADGPPGLLRLTAPTSLDSSGPCGEATGTAFVGLLPYSSDFAGKGEAGWNTYGGCWAVEGDVYVESCGGGIGAKALTGSTGWRDYTVSADVQITSSGGNAGVLARVTDPGVGADSHHGYHAFFDVNTQQLVIARQEYAYVPLASVPIVGGARSGEWYRLTFTVDGSKLSASLTPAGGGEVTKVSVTDPYDSFPHGLVGLRHHAGTASYRNVTVTPGR